MSDVERPQLNVNKPVAEPIAAQESESVLRRWSRRKSQADKLPTEAEPAAAQDNVEIAAEPVVELTDAEMPPLESLDEKTDMSGFFSQKVSAELRRQALRKVFHLAKFNIRDGLDDYDDDFTQFTILDKNIVTAHQRHMLVVEAKRQQEEAAKAAAKEAEAETLAQQAETTDETLENDHQSAVETELDLEAYPLSPDNAGEEESV